MTEGEKAKAWRKSHKLSVRALSEITGYSTRSITAFESGVQPKGEPVQPDAMLKYRLVCAAVHHGHHRRFDWPLQS